MTKGNLYASHCPKTSSIDADIAMISELHVCFVGLTLVKAEVRVGDGGREHVLGEPPLGAHT